MKPHHICIQTDRYQASLDFYTHLLGFNVVKETPDFHGRDYNTWLKLDYFMIELQTGKADTVLNSYSKTSKGIVHLGLWVENLDDEYDRLIKKGFDGFLKKNGDIIYSVEGGRLFKVSAPEGTIIEVRDSQAI